jgi:hypothetical protein
MCRPRDPAVREDPSLLLSVPNQWRNASDEPARNRD